MHNNAALSANQENPSSMEFQLLLKYVKSSSSGVFKDSFSIKIRSVGSLED
jgi:hypothetical protein